MSIGTNDLALLRDFLAAMERAKAKCFLVGAGARILAFDERWKLNSPRSTSDWDFAVRTESWEHWAALTARLVEGPSARFRAGSTEHRFRHVDGGALDVVPYGGVESPRGEILWPGQTRMSVLGFQESEAGCEFVDTGAGLIVPIPAVPSLALLKLFAYLDRRLRAENKDIQDFDWYLKNYASADNELRIHDELGDVLRADSIDIRDAGAMLLGRDVARMHAREAIAPIRSLLVEARDPWSPAITDLFLGRNAGDDDDDLRRRAEGCTRFRAFELGLDLTTPASTVEVFNVD